MSEYTSLEVSKRLAEAGFAITPPDGMWGQDPITHEWRIDSWYYTTNDRRTYLSSTLLTWLMTKRFFSRRAATVQIAYRAVMVGEALDPNSDTSVRQDVKWVGHYFVTAFNGSGELIGEGEAETIPDAYAEAVIQVLKVQS